jgi:transcriptional regulatory protein RtcR
MDKKLNVALGVLGRSLDAGLGARRWRRWRPSVDIAQHPDLPLDRLELLHVPGEEQLAAQVLADVRAVSPDTEVRSHCLSLADAWDFEQVYGALHDFARAYPFDPERERYLVHVTTGTHVVQICLFLLTESRHMPGVLLQAAPPSREARQAARAGAPASTGSYTLIDLDLERYDRLAARFLTERHEGRSLLTAGIQTRSPTFNLLIERLEQVATGSTAPILLGGPTGAGKSGLARRVYELKRARRQVEGALVEVNCATLRGDAAMSALFGHEKGAFTGAVRARPGLLRQADRGLLFLDEIGELGLDEQAMLLRALEDGVFLPLGADREVSSRFQLIAGTNRDLQADVRGGRFREDLLARIDLWTFLLPGLRERPEDLEPNLDYELERCAGLVGGRVTISREARQAFLTFAADPAATWARNFRDFTGAVLRMATLAPGGRITEAEVSDEVARLLRRWGPVEPVGSLLPGGRAVDQVGEDLLALHLDPARLDRFDRVQLADVLTVCARSRSLSAAGRELFAVSLQRRASRNDADRLRKYLARFGLNWAQVSSAP